MSRLRLLLVVLALVLTACSAPATGGELSPLPPFDADEFSRRLEATSRPMVVNVWASWCIPCRSEAPLLVTAHARFSDRIDFVGIDIQDTQRDAAAFLAEYGIAYENLFDPDADIRGVLGGSGVPITYFIGPGGDLVEMHFGVIDEQQLALQIDELLRRSGG